MGNCCDQAHDGTDYEFPYAGLKSDRVDPRRRALEAQSMQQVPKAGRSCFVCYTCAAPSQVRKSDVRFQEPPGTAKIDINAGRREYAAATASSNRLLGRMT
eukprot:Skav224646  [mRNA]  locus=scaffold4300:47262:48115:+ [translate_table: standard]